jgi:hypothetical protein
VSLVDEFAAGLQYVDIGSPLAATAFRAKGFDLALVAGLGRAEDIPAYAEDPEHVEYVAAVKVRSVE